MNILKCIVIEQIKLTLNVCWKQRARWTTKAKTVEVTQKTNRVLHNPCSNIYFVENILLKRIAVHRTNNPYLNIYFIKNILLEEIAVYM